MANVPALATNATAAPKLFPALLSVISAPEAAVNVDTPEMSSAPVLVMFPVVAVAPSVPDAVIAPNTKPLASVKPTFVAATTETAPPN